jgi:hypothetical protein
MIFTPTAPEVETVDAFVEYAPGTSRISIL